MQPTPTSRHPQDKPACPYCPTLTKVGVHSRKEQRYRCHQCKKTFTQTYATPLYGFKTELDIVTLVLTLLIFGCPIPAVVVAFKLDERTLADWISKAGEHAMRVGGVLRNVSPRVLPHFVWSGQQKRRLRNVGPHRCLLLT
ncbi:transposase [Deinococcus cavernae]|uniref:transposase n=1 Tax=Deinococcus cavernae TaxID=2320857 RepID=UPI003B75B433